MKLVMGYVLAILVPAYVAGLVLTLVSCYDANSPHLPPCPDAGEGYTSPAGCFGHTVDGGRDAR